jgi:hypothetical protein
MCIPKKNGYAVTPLDAFVVTGFAPTHPLGPGSLSLAYRLKVVGSSGDPAATTLNGMP